MGKRSTIKARVSQTVRAPVTRPKRPKTDWVSEEETKRERGEREGERDRERRDKEIYERGEIGRSERQKERERERRRGRLGKVTVSNGQ